MTRLIKVIVEATTVADPMSLLRRTSKSTRPIAEELARRGHNVHAVTVGRCLHDLGYSLQANRKTKEGPQHGSRDAQFRHINRLVKTHIKTGDPVISVDTKKKELVGEFRNAGRTWRPGGTPSMCRCRLSAPESRESGPTARTTSRGTVRSSTWPSTTTRLSLPLKVSVAGGVSTDGVCIVTHTDS